MNRDQVMREIEAVIDEAERSRMFGKLEIEFVAGTATFLRKTEQKKLTDSGTAYESPKRFR